jgi:membrane protein DedA with SNARE-associated domain
MDQLSHDVLTYVATHPNMAVWVIGLTAFAESFAFVSFFVPGFTVLVAAGALVQAGVIDPYSAVAAGCLGAILGDAFSYMIGQSFGDALPKMWPFRNHPAALERGVRFFKAWGWPSVFIGRFLGPLRAFVPLAAGMCRMRAVPFYVANVVSALIWAPALLYSGYLIRIAMLNGWTLEEKALAVGTGLAVFVGLAWLARKIFKAE